MLSRRSILQVMFGGIVAAAPVSAFAQTDPAAARIRSFYNTVEATMKSSGGIAARYSSLSPAVLRTFDVASMARIAGGPAWSKIPSGKQSSITQAFGRFLVATYANRISGYSGETFTVSPNVESRAGGRLVRTRIANTSIDYVINGSGRVIDVYLDGAISELASRRSEFSSLLASGGPDALEASLRQRADRLLGAG